MAIAFMLLSQLEACRPFYPNAPTDRFKVMLITTMDFLGPILYRPLGHLMGVASLYNLLNHFSVEPSSLSTGMYLRAFLSLAICLNPSVWAFPRDGVVFFEQNTDQTLFPVVSDGQAASILISPEDWPGVHRAAADFAADIQRVSSVLPDVVNSTAGGSALELPIIVGTLGKSALIDAVVNGSQLDVSSLRGGWETFLATEVTDPIPGIDRAYVIVGSDKRGTIYALYDLSEQFGESRAYSNIGYMLLTFHQ